MVSDRIKSSVEAILFASGDPVSPFKIAEVLECDEKAVAQSIEKINEEYKNSGRPFEILCLNGEYQLCTLAQYGEVIKKALEQGKNAPLSQAAMEVLAIIAYNQPVTRGFVEQVRGVDCSSIVRTLTEKGLIEEAGRLPIPGRPISYRTTPHFLRSFSLESLEGLPVLPSDDEVEQSRAESEQLDLFVSASK